MKQAIVLMITLLTFIPGASSNLFLDSCNPGALIWSKSPLPGGSLVDSAVSDQSTAENFRVYENFTIAHNHVCNVQWWGMNLMFDGVDWMECDKSVSFLVSFHQNNAGQPGALIASQTVTPVENRDWRIL